MLEYIIFNENNIPILVSRNIDRILSECKYRVKDKCQNVYIKVMTEEDFIQEYFNDR